MAEERKNNFSSDQCLHINQIEDSEVICVDCGKVLGAIFLPSFKQETESYPLKGEEDQDTFMKDLCDRAHIPPCVIDQAEQYRDDVLRSQLWGKFNNQELSAYAVQEILCRFKMPRSPQEIAYFANIKVATLRKIEQSLIMLPVATDKNMSHPFYEGRKQRPALKVIIPKKNIYQRNNPKIIHTVVNIATGKPEDYVERFCALLTIDFCHISRIKTVLLQVYGLGNVRPHCLAAAVIYLYSKNYNLGHDMKSVCKNCGTSCVNIYKIVKSIRECVNKIMQTDKIYNI